MPLYEHECESCGHRFEVIQKFSDAPIEVCPRCGGHVRKLLSGSAIQFKGTGWYVTDYARKEKTGKSEGSASSSSSNGRKTDDTSSPSANSSSSGSTDNAPSGSSSKDS